LKVGFHGFLARCLGFQFKFEEFQAIGTTSDLKDFRDFTSYFKVFKVDFRDLWSDFTDYRDFRIEFGDFRCDFRTFVHRISKVVSPSVLPFSRMVPRYGSNGNLNHGLNCHANNILTSSGCLDAHHSVRSIISSSWGRR